MRTCFAPSNLLKKKTSKDAQNLNMNKLWFCGDYDKVIFYSLNGLYIQLIK